MEAVRDDSPQNVRQLESIVAAHQEGFREGYADGCRDGFLRYRDRYSETDAETYESDGGYLLTVALWGVLVACALGIIWLSAQPEAQRRGKGL